MSLYKAPSFVVRDSKQTSPTKVQTKGLRQGCPISPYLFSLLLTHFFSMLNKNMYGLMSGVINTPSSLWDFEYADGTVLLSNSADQITRLLQLIQFEGSQRGPLLNEDKCEHLRLHSESRIIYAPLPYSSNCTCELCSGHLRSDNLAPFPLEIKYLGVYVSSFGPRKNVRYRVSQAVHASKLLKPLLSPSPFLEAPCIPIHCTGNSNVCYVQRTLF